MTSLVVVGGGGAGGGILPNFDLSQMGKKPEWLQWIIDNKDLILSIMAGITAGLLAWKLGLGGIEALGIGIIITGIVYAIQNLIKYLKDPSWNNFGKIIIGIGIAITGLGIAFLGLPAIVAGVIITILGLLAANWDKVKQGFNTAIEWIKNLGNKAWEWFANNIDKIQEKFGWLGVVVTGVFISLFDWLTRIVSGLVEAVRDILEGLFRGVKQILDGIIQMFKGNFKSGLLSVIRGIVNSIAGVINGIISGLNGILYPLRMLISGLGQAIGKPMNVNLVAIPKLPYVKTGAIINMPNRGTLVGGALGGESGREGVIPLTDSQAMETLGEAIGRYINLNATIPVYVGNRQIAREIKRINTENDFAFNS